MSHSTFQAPIYSQNVTLFPEQHQKGNQPLSRFSWVTLPQSFYSQQFAATHSLTSYTAPVDSLERKNLPEGVKWCAKQHWAYFTNSAKMMLLEYLETKSELDEIKRRCPDDKVMICKFEVMVSEYLKEFKFCCLARREQRGLIKSGQLPSRIQKRVDWFRSLQTFVHSAPHSNDLLEKQIGEYLNTNLRELSVMYNGSTNAGSFDGYSIDERFEMVDRVLMTYACEQRNPDHVPDDHQGEFKDGLELLGIWERWICASFFKLNNEGETQLSTLTPLFTDFSEKHGCHEGLKLLGTMIKLGNAIEFDENDDSFGWGVDY